MQAMESHFILYNNYVSAGMPEYTAGESHIILQKIVCHGQCYHKSAQRSLKPAQKNSPVTEVKICPCQITLLLKYNNISIIATP